MSARGQVEPIKRFTDRKASLKRVWAALEALPLGSAPRDTKQNRLIILMKRPQGACMQELMQSTGWQAHSVRGVISHTLRKQMKLQISLQADGNTRTYRIAG